MLGRLTYYVRMDYPHTTSTASVQITSCPPEIPDEWGFEVNQHTHRTVSGNVQAVEDGPTRRTIEMRLPLLSDSDFRDLLHFFSVPAAQTWTALYSGATNPKTGGPEWMLRPFRLRFGDLQESLSSNLVTNNDFADWTAGEPDDWTETDGGAGAATDAAPGAALAGSDPADSVLLTTDATFTAGDRLRVLITVAGYTSGTLKVRFGSGAYFGLLTANGDYIYDLICDSSGKLSLYAEGTFALTVKDASVWYGWFAGDHYVRLTEIPTVKRLRGRKWDVVLRFREEATG